jgi:hypothetical protein
MTDEQIVEMVMKLSVSWRYRNTYNTKPFEDDMIAMCKKVREATLLNPKKDLTNE